MNINRNNYEEYFLLYADNELSKAERKMVEVFVNENQDLKEEFCMLKLTINIPDEEVKLDDKSFLFKNGSAFEINENNYEEIFVLYFDGELSEKEKVETESFVAKHRELKADFELIGKAKLDADLSIVYPGKKELYRKEKKGTVVSIMLWRYVAAAVLIGFGLWISVPYFSTHDAENSGTAQLTPEKNSAPVKPKSIIPQTRKEATPLASSAVNEQKNDIYNPANVNHKAPKKQTTNVEMVKSEVKVRIPSITKPIQQLKKEAIEVVALKPPVKKFEEAVDNDQSPIRNEAKTAIQKVEPQIEPNYIKTAAYNPDASADNDNYVFYDVPAEEFNKTKVGGFLKKVKRIVERTNPITRLLEGNEEPVIAKKF